MDVRQLFTRQPWPHQEDGTRRLLSRLHDCQSVCLCSPTGGGKSAVIEAALTHFNSQGLKTCTLTNRKLLTKQIAKGFKDRSIDFGVIAASMPKSYNPRASNQICSMQTIASRDNAPEADVVFIDEAHLQLGPDALNIIQDYMGQGAKIIPVSATPVGVNLIAPEIVVAGKNSELRACGAHVPAIVKGAKEIDLRKVRRVKEKYDYGSIREGWSQAIVGHVLADYRRFNPDQKPTLCTAPGVPESRALAQHFYNNGIRSAHIAAGEVWIDGNYYNDGNDGKYRDRVLQRWEEGSVKIVFHCQVLREAFDYPALYHLILATPICSLKDYLQQVGRVLRAHPSLDHVLITDHGGSCRRLGSPNEDRDWETLYNLTEKEVREEQEKRTEKEELEEVPAVCPKCGTMVKAGGRCPPPPMGCGEEIEKNNPKRLRFVVESGGDLVTIPDATLSKSKRKVSTDSIEQKRWDRLYYASLNSKGRGSNFNQLRARYKKEHGEYPPDNLNRMPLDDMDWGRKISLVKREKLRQKDDSST